MNGAHDLGGMHGMGPIVAERDEPVFHHGWERRVFGMTLAAGFLGKWNIDMARYAREQMPGPSYLNTTYYEHWLFGLERLLVEKGLLSPDELRTGRPQGPAPDPVGPLTSREVFRVSASHSVTPRDGGCVMTLRHAGFRRIAAIDHHRTFDVAEGSLSITGLDIDLMVRHQKGLFPGQGGPFIPLTKAQEDLRSVLTMRQEAVAVMFGLLP